MPCNVHDFSKTPGKREKKSKRSACLLCPGKYGVEERDGERKEKRWRR
jgi:hypothetical protein